MYLARIKISNQLMEFIILMELMNEWIIFFFFFFFDSMLFHFLNVINFCVCNLLERKTRKMKVD